MSPKSDNTEPSSGPDVTVDIPHEANPIPPATAPPLPNLEPLPPRPITISDNTPTPTPPSVMPLATQSTLHVNGGRRWSMILLYVISAFLVAVLVVFAGRWIFRKAVHHTKTNQSVTATRQGQIPSPPPTSNQNLASGSSSSIPSGNTQNQNQMNTNKQLPNNGPGDVVALFVGTALVVGGLHYIYTLRRAR